MVGYIYKSNEKELNAEYSYNFGDTKKKVINSDHEMKCLTP